MVSSHDSPCRTKSWDMTSCLNLSNEIVSFIVSLEFALSEGKNKNHHRCLQDYGNSPDKLSWRSGWPRNSQKARTKNSTINAAKCERISSVNVSANSWKRVFRRAAKGRSPGNSTWESNPHDSINNAHEVVLWSIQVVYASSLNDRTKWIFFNLRPCSSSDQQRIMLQYKSTPNGENCQHCDFASMMMRTTAIETDEQIPLTLPLERFQDHSRGTKRCPSREIPVPSIPKHCTREKSFEVLFSEGLREIVAIDCTN